MLLLFVGVPVLKSWEVVAEGKVGEKQRSLLLSASPMCSVHTVRLSPATHRFLGGKGLEGVLVEGAQALDEENVFCQKRRSMNLSSLCFSA